MFLGLAYVKVSVHFITSGSHAWLLLEHLCACFTLLYIYNLIFPSLQCNLVECFWIFQLIDEYWEILREMQWMQVISNWSRDRDIGFFTIARHEKSGKCSASRFAFSNFRLGEIPNLSLFSFFNFYNISISI